MIYCQVSFSQSCMIKRQNVHTLNSKEITLRMLLFAEFSSFQYVEFRKFQKKRYWFNHNIIVVTFVLEVIILISNSINVNIYLKILILIFKKVYNIYRICSSWIVIEKIHYSALSCRSFIGEYKKACKISVNDWK